LPTGIYRSRELQRRRRRMLAVLRSVSKVKVNLGGSRMRPSLKIYARSI
jgi:hypothetical protein